MFDSMSIYSITSKKIFSDRCASKKKKKKNDFEAENG